MVSEFTDFSSYLLFRLEQQIPTYNDEFVSCEPVECILGSLEFGRVKYATIKMK